MDATLHAVSPESEWIDVCPQRVAEHARSVPDAPPATSAPADPAGEYAAAEPESPTVLVVEDEAAIAQLLDEFLCSEGYRVLIARDGQAALAYAQRVRPALVLSDCMMPGMDGNQLVKELRGHPSTRAIPIALMSSTRLNKYRLPGVPFLAKPFELDEVLSLVARYVPHDGPSELYGEG